MEKKNRKRHIRKRRAGQPETSYKLDARVREKICEGILEGLTVADAAALAGVSRGTVNEWRRRGEEEPESLYGKFAEAFELAKLQSKRGMIQKLLRHEDPRWTWKLMCNRWPEEFRERVATELSGPDGGPIHTAANPFVVEVHCNQPDGFWEQFVPEDQREAVFGKRQSGNSSSDSGAHYRRTQNRDNHAWSP